MCTVNSAVFQLLDKIVSKTNIEDDLNKSKEHWKNSHFSFGEYSPEDLKEYHLDFALSELDKDYLNLFLIPYTTGDSSESESDNESDNESESDSDKSDYEVLAAYKLGGICMSTGEIYIKTSPWGIDTYEDRNVVAQFRIAKSMWNKKIDF